MATMYVAPTASGNGSGSDWANAAGIGSLDKMVRAAGADGTVLMRADAGAYNLTGSVTISSGGTDGHPVTIKGVTAGGVEQNIVVNGTRPVTWDPANPAGNEAFRLSGNASNIVMENMTFANVKNAIHAISDLKNVVIKDMAANNVERFFEDLAGGTAKTATLTGLTIVNVEVTNFSKGVIRLQDDTSKVVIDDVHGSGGLDKSKFAIGVHIDGTVHEVVIKNSSMGNVTDTTGYYWNGDGFATEGGAYDIRFENTRSYGNTDAGYDLKSKTTVLVNAMADDNAKNFRLWGDQTLVNPTSTNPHLRGGSGEQLHVQVLSQANAKIVGGTFADAAMATEVFKLEGGTLDVSDAAIAHAAGGQVFNVANAASTLVQAALKVANVQGVLGWSDKWVPAAGLKYGTLDDNVLVKAIGGNEVFYGTKNADAFYFDTAKGAQFGADTIRNFGTEDRIVTTSKLADPDNDGKILANASDQFALPGSSGSFKVFVPTGKAIAQLKLLDTVQEGGATHFVYGAVSGATGTTDPVSKLLASDYKAALEAQLPPVKLPSAGLSGAASKPVAPVKTVSDVPLGATVSKTVGETMTGTASKDLFFFDTADGLSFGADQIKKFGGGDRIVTTTKLYDANNDGKVTANSSDRFFLPGATGAANDTTGTLKLFNEGGKAVSNLHLVDTVSDHGQAYYVYSAGGDAIAGGALHFG